MFQGLTMYFKYSSPNFLFNFYSVKIAWSGYAYPLILKNILFFKNTYLAVFFLFFDIPMYLGVLNLYVRYSFPNTSLRYGSSTFTM